MIRYALLSSLLLVGLAVDFARAECRCGPSCRCTPADHCGCLAAQKCGGGAGLFRARSAPAVMVVAPSWAPATHYYPTYQRQPAAVWYPQRAPTAYRMVCEGGTCRLVPVR